MPTDDVLRLLGPVTPSVPLRVPRPGRSEPEAVLADANHRARQGSLDRLAVVLPGIDVGRLAQTADGSAAVTGRWVDPSGGGVPPDPGGVLHAAIQLATATPRAARMVDGDRVADLYLGDAPVVRDALDRGWTLLADRGEGLQPGLAALADDLARAFGAPVSVVAEVATTSSRGAAPSLRGGDHLALQLVGAQTRFLQRPVSLSPHPAVAETGAVVTAAQVDCTPGVAVYLPRGWHGLRFGREEVSVAVELEIRRPTVIDVLHALADLAAARPLLRADVPFDAERQHGAYAGSVMADPNLWTSEFGGLVDWPGFDLALASIRASVPVTTPAVGERDGRNRVPGGLLIGPEADGEVVVAAGGTVVAVPAASVGDLAALAAGDGEAPARADGLRDALAQQGWVLPRR